ncbi:MAG: ribonuclease III domain-containing protein [Bacillota bacterium]|nr:ribonuclease III domain-containing protein [Bacillota bacterium]
MTAMSPYSWIDAINLPSLTLAYIGDGVYEMAIRRYLLEQGIRKPEELHHKAVEYVKATFQSRFYHEILPTLSEQEAAVLKRGRNSKSGHQPKHTDVQDYRKATAVEALVGALYLAGKTQRLEEIFHCLFALIEKESKK